MHLDLEKHTFNITNYLQRSRLPLHSDRNCPTLMNANTFDVKMKITVRKVPRANFCCCIFYHACEPE